MVIDMPICANAAAETASITSANNNERIEGMKRIVRPFAWSSLGLPGDALLLRVAWMERRDCRTKRSASFVSFANSSAMTFSFRSSYVWSITLTTIPRRTYLMRSYKNREAQMNELIKIAHLVAERGCIM